MFTRVLIFDGVFLFFFLFLFFTVDTKLGDVLGEDYEDLRSVLGKLATSTTVGALVANDELQRGLCDDAAEVQLPLRRLMEGFIGECKRIVTQSQQQPAGSPSKGKRNAFCSFPVSLTGFS